MAALASRILAWIKLTNIEVKQSIMCILWMHSKKINNSKINGLQMSRQSCAGKYLSMSCYLLTLLSFSVVHQIMMK